VSIGKLTLTKPYEFLFPNLLYDNGIDLLAINVSHLIPLISLPFYHRDPFDRIIIAQALVEKMTILSADHSYDTYPVKKIW
jgi:PIN domain nuclease of toxin-antitoxin system